MLTILLTKQADRLARVPVSIFGAVMGTAGLSRALHLAVGLFGIADYWGYIFGVLASIIFIVLAASFAFKWFYYPQVVLANFNHPANGSFFGTVPIAILLLSTTLQPLSTVLYYVLWCTGTTLMFALAYITCYRLLTIKQEQVNITPVLILPVVGVLNVAVTGGQLPWDWALEVSLLALSVGGVLTIVFFTLIFIRLMQHDQLTQAMEPTLMILMSPFAVCFLAYVNIGGHVDLFAAVLFYCALFMFFVLVFRIFLHQKTFLHSWWSVGFPVAALTNSALKYALNNHKTLSAVIAMLLLAFLIILIVFMLIKTLYLLFKKELF